MSLDRSIQELLCAATEKLSAGGNTLARLDSEILLAHVCACERMDLFTRPDKLTADEEQLFLSYVDRRQLSEPVAYITGTQAFWTLDLKVNEHTLIPRPDTETLVEAVLDRADHTQVETILDLGTGSGCILLSLLSELPQAQGTGVDLSRGALAVAGENASANGLAERVQFTESDWFQNVECPEQGFSVIVSNPPYIPAADIKTLMVDVQQYEPLSALDGGKDGLDPYRLIAENAGHYLADSGLIAVEMGVYQADNVAAIFRATGFVAIEYHKDLAGVDRVVSAKKAK